MLKCPRCDNTLDQDFGMITCGQCQAVLMIDISGQVQMASDDPQPPPETTDGDGFETAVDDDATDPPEESITAPDNFESVHTLDSEYQGDSLEQDNQIENTQNLNATDSGFDPIGEDVDQLTAMDAQTDSEQFTESLSGDQFFEETGGTDGDFDEHSVLDADIIEDEESDSEENADLPDPPEDESYTEEDDEPVEDSIHQTDFADDQEEEVEVFAMPSEPDPAPVDVTNYANSETSSLEDGEFLYDVWISRIDSKDLKDALKYVLIDEKLKLNHHEYMKAIKDGEVMIPNLNPIKAKRIVEQLQYFSLDISWKQKRVVMEMIDPDIAEEEPTEGQDLGEDANV